MIGKPLIFILAGTLLMAVLFLWFKPEGQAPQISAPVIAPVVEALPAVVTPPPAPAPKVFELAVKNKQLVSGPHLLQVVQGDAVTIRITSDIAEELHLHGYDQTVDLQANVPGNLSFVADHSGRFEYELEHSGIELGVLEVLPR